MADDVTITVHVRDLTGPGFNSVNRNLNQLQRNANQMGAQLRIVGGQLGNVASAASNAGQSMGGGMGLRGQMIGAAAAMGTTLLPTIGALAPMLTGLAVVGGGAALAMDDLKKKAKELKKPFEDWQKVANKAVAPHTEKAVKSLKGAMKDLTPVIETGAETFGRITERAAKFADSPAFKSALAKNAEMGAKWVEEFAGSVGRFTQAFLDFGTKSKPALDAWQNLLGGLLDTGLPGMFKEMEQGVEGSSDILNGFAYVINDSLLPSLGKIAGSFADAFGPLVKELLIGAGNGIKLFGELFGGAMKVLEPAAKTAADVFRGLNEIFSIGFSVAGSFAKALGGALLDTMLAFFGQEGNVRSFNGSLTDFAAWVKENQTAIRTAFLAMAMGLIDMVNAGVQMLPLLTGAFTGFAKGALMQIDLVISGLAQAFGDVPVIGDKLKEANRQFDDWAGNATQKLDDFQGAVNRFSDVAGEKLGRAKLVLSVDQAEANLKYIKEQLKDPALTKERRAKLTADKEEAEQRIAAAKRRLAEFDRKKASAKLDAEPGSFWSKVRAAVAARIPKKTGPVDANTGGFWSRVRALSGRVVGTSYVNVVAKAAKNLNPFTNANGSIMRFYADGGTEQHVAQIAPAGAMRIWAEPETGGEAYIPLASSKRPRSRQIAEETVSILGGAVQWFAKGGAVGKAARGAKDEIRAATSGNTEQGLLRLMDAISKGHIKMATALKQVNSALEKAKDKLSSLKSAASQLQESVRGGVLSAADITRSASGDKPVTLASIRSGLVQSRDKATAFADALAQLKKKGLDKGLLQDIAEAGIEGGGLETAGALLGASGSELKSLNSLQHQIAKAALSAGKTTADAFYGAQIKTQEKLVKALDRLADALKGVKKKAAGGPAGGLTVVGEEGPELLQLPFGSTVYSNGQSKRMAWESMLSEPRRGSAAGRRAAVPTGGRPEPVVVEIRSSGSDIDEFLLRVLRKAINVRGGNAQIVLTGRTT
jgi:hypothetical protein